MEAHLQSLIQSLLAWFALPSHGLTSVFVIALLGATLLPLASEPAVFLFVKASPELFWIAVVVATIGNTIGGGLSWWIGYGAEAAWERSTHHKPAEAHALAWLRRFGPRACLLGWLPLVGDPLCAVAGWLRLPFWPCLVYMGIGKFIRYTVMTQLLLWGWASL
ncbi:MAG: DedA family protein [Pelomonas sp.]|nr:DedA family protein [Roseateles sp.]